MMRLSRYAVALLWPLVSGCSWIAAVPGVNRVVGDEGLIRDRQGEYLQAVTIPRTEIPAGLDGFVIDDLLVIPELSDPDAQPFLDAPRPRALASSSDREIVIQRMRERSWIIVDVSPGEVWPRVRDYWRSKGVAITQENPTQGQMDTAWFTEEGNVLNRDKFRVFVDTGFQNNTSEIRLIHVSSPQATPVFEQVNWPEASMDSDTESRFVTDMASYLADVSGLYAASSVSFLAGNISSSGKAAIFTSPAGTDILSLQADYERCWAAVGRALARAGLEITSENSTVGMYEVLYRPGMENEEEQEPGWFTKVVTLNGWIGGDDEPPSLPFRIEVLEVGDGADVRITPINSRAPDRVEAGKALLRLIRNTIA